MRDFNYSVIIPHYNTPDLLYKCLDSIPVRNDIQVIVVDDNSDEDKKPTVLRSNVEVIYLSKLDSQGAGHARNVGLTKARGKWLLFADADDFYLEGAFELSDRYLNSSYDIIYFGIDSVDSNTGRRVERYKVYNKYVVACDNINKDRIDMLRFRHDVPWGKMIRHSLVVNNNIKFGETKYCNDTLFSTLTALNACSVYADIMPFYCVTERMGSLITHLNLDAYFIRYEVILKKNSILRSQGYGKYQMPIGFYIRKISKFGFVELIKAFILGMEYKANFFIGYKQWMKHFQKRNKHIS